MKIIPTFVLEDSDGKPPRWITGPLDGISLFPAERLLGLIVDATAFILRENREENGCLDLRGGYAFFGLNQRVVFAHHDLNEHLLWDAAFRELENRDAIEWQDCGGGGFRYVMCKEKCSVRVSHSRGEYAVFDERAFFSLARKAVSEMAYFKKALEQHFLATSDCKVDRLLLEKSLWSAPK